MEQEEMLFTPAIAKQHRHSTNKRDFFGSWKLISRLQKLHLEDGLYPYVSDQVAYERGVKESFDYNNVGQFYASYISLQNTAELGHL